MNWTIVILKSIVFPWLPIEIDKVSGHVYALGGISSINAHDCIDAGAYGVAVVGSILGSDDPFHSTKEILKTVSDWNFFLNFICFINK